MRKKKKLTEEQMEAARTKDFFDLIAPGVVRFFSDYYVVGDMYCSAWVLREYPTSTEVQALLSQIADRNGVTVRIYHRLVEGIEQRKIVQNANRKNRMMAGGNDLNDTIEAEGNLQDVVELLGNLRENREPLLHVSVFMELRAKNREALNELQNDIQLELTRQKLFVDRLTLRQKEGFLSVMPFGSNQFGAQFERVLPASSAANLFPFNFSGKTDPEGFYLGRDKFGSNILVDLERRAEDKTNGNVLILGNSGQGKSFLLKLLLTNLREAGKKIICLDAEDEYRELGEHLGGCYLDFMSGESMINPLEPYVWSEDAEERDTEMPDAFKRSSRHRQHIAYLRDFFRIYKSFDDAENDTLEILLLKLYARFGIDDGTDYGKLKHTDYPVMEDLYQLCEEELFTYDDKKKNLYTEETLQRVCLGLHSMCRGADSLYFNGYTSLKDGQFIVAGVKGVMELNQKLKDTLLFSILSFMNNQMLTEGNTAASIDELYLFLTNLTAIEYIRNIVKRARKKESLMIMGSQNIEDFLLPGIKEYTKPLFAIPTHQFLFNPGQVNQKEYMDTLQMESTEYDLIRHPERGKCLYRCGNERYLLQVDAPEYKEKLFGKAGGR